MKQEAEAAKQYQELMEKQKVCFLSWDSRCMIAVFNFAV